MQYQNHNLLKACEETTFKSGFLLLFQRTKKAILNLTPLKKTVAVITMIAMVTTGYYSFFINSSQGADYTFTQTSWSGGQTANTATHNDNRTGWSEYSTKDSNTSAVNSGTNVEMIKSSSTSNIDFNNSSYYALQDNTKIQISSGKISLKSVNPPLTSDTLTDGVKASQWVASVDDTGSTPTETTDGMYWGQYTYIGKLAGDFEVSHYSIDGSSYGGGTSNLVFYVDANNYFKAFSLFNCVDYCVTSKKTQMYANSMVSGVNSGNYMAYQTDSRIWKYLKIKRVGSTATTYYSTNGSTWNLIKQYDNFPTSDGTIKFYGTGAQSGAPCVIKNFTVTTATSTGGFATSPYYATTTASSQLNTSSWGNIAGITATQNTPNNTNIKYLVSFDNRSSWKYWNGSSWQASTLANISTNGMTKTTLEGISKTQWSSSGGFTAGTFDIAAGLSTSDSAVTPWVDNVAVSYENQYPTSPQTLTSNIYNTTFSSARLQKIEWTETLPTNTDIKFQIRTSPDSSTWTEYLGPDGTNSTYFTSNTGTETMPSIFTSGDNDQYIQYKVFLSSTDGVNSPTLSDVTITYSDAAPPTLTGVTDGTTYFTSVTPTTANGTATLNGQPYNSGTAITQNGTYTLTVTNDQNTSTSVTFTLIVSKIVINPTPQKITTDYNAGIITVSGSATEATQATINTTYTLSSGSSQITIPSGTKITPTTGETINITNLTASNISNTIQQENSNSKGAIKIGIPDQNITFDQPVTVTMDVQSSYNGKTLTIYSRPDNGGDWTYHGSCTVADSQCTFTTDHATEYTGNYEVSNSPTPTDTNLDINATISISCEDTVTLGTITGTGQSSLATNEADCNIKTINSNGYQLAWQASTAYMENENGDRINAYTPASLNTPEVWDVSASDSEWGARIKSTSTDPDIVSGGIWDNSDSYSGTFLNVGTSSFVVANRSTETNQTGSDETIIFGAEIGSNKFQPTGTYTTEVIITATTL